MRVLLLSPYPERLGAALAGESMTFSTGNVNTWDIQPGDYDFIVAYGYRFIIREPVLSRYKGRLINLHIGYLPWNRGADPCFWSWFDGTYKGISIHHIDAGLDTGPVIARRILSPPNTMTLRECYEYLRTELENLFAEKWPSIKADAGTLHMEKDKDTWFAQLSAGWDSPCSEVEGLGRKAREGTI